MTTNRILAELARTKALFQARTIAAILDAPPPTIKESLTVEPEDQNSDKSCA